MIYFYAQSLEILQSLWTYDAADVAYLTHRCGFASIPCESTWRYFTWKPDADHPGTLKCIETGPICRRWVGPMLLGNVIEHRIEISCPANSCAIFQTATFSFWIHSPAAFTPAGERKVTRYEFEGRGSLITTVFAFLALGKVHLSCNEMSNLLDPEISDEATMRKGGSNSAVDLQVETKSSKYIRQSAIAEWLCSWLKNEILTCSSSKWLHHLAATIPWFSPSRIGQYWRMHGSCSRSEQLAVQSRQLLVQHPAKEPSASSWSSQGNYERQRHHSPHPWRRYRSDRTLHLNAQQCQHKFPSLFWTFLFVRQLLAKSLRQILRPQEGHEKMATSQQDYSVSRRFWVHSRREDEAHLQKQEVKYYIYIYVYK